MTLDEYLLKNAITSGAFAAKIRASVSAVKKWRIKARVPRPRMMKKIKTATKNKVGPSDWY